MRKLLAKIWGKVSRMGLTKFLPDKLYLKIRFYLEMGRKLDLKNPQTFNEKLQWLKLYDRNSEYTKMVDKYEVRKYIAEKIGEEYLIPLLGVWDKFDDIDFSKLPDQFVLKCTHDSGGLVICKDKSKLDINAARKKINKSLKRNFFKLTREWPYKNVKPRIIAEKFMEDRNGELNDYKFFCFQGMVHNVMVCIDRNIGDTKFYFFDKDWILLRLNIRGKEAPEGFTLPVPDKKEDMFNLASLLSQNLPYARIDLYNVDGKIYFGEITFFPDSGFDSNLLDTTDVLFGEMIKLGGEK